MKKKIGKLRKKNNRKAGGGRKYSHTQFVNGSVIIHNNY